MLIDRLSATVAVFLFTVNFLSPALALATGHYLVRVQASSSSKANVKSASLSLLDALTSEQNDSLIHRGVEASSPEQTRPSSLSNLLGSVAAYEKASSEAVSIYALTLSESQKLALTKDPNVLSIENDDVVVLDDPSHAGSPSSNVISFTSIARTLGLETLSEVDTSSTLVAVSDTGVDLTHPSLTSNFFVNLKEQSGVPGYDDDQNGCIDDINGCDLADSDGDPSPVSSSEGDHGTHVAGLIAQVALTARLIIAKGFKTSDGTAQMSDLLRSLYYSVNAGAKVINCSWGINRAPLQAERDAFAFALRSGALPVIAAGNSGRDASTTSPAGIDGVLTVGSINSIDDVSSFSNFGKSVSVFAPGGDSLALSGRADETLRSTIPVSHGSFGTMRGTSMAAPLVTGLAALVFATQPLLSPAQVKMILISTARKKTTSLMSGVRLEILIPDAAAAVALAKVTLPLAAPVPTTKSVSPEPPATELLSSPASSPTGCSLARLRSVTVDASSIGSVASSPSQASLKFDWVIFFVAPLVASFALRRRR